MITDRILDNYHNIILPYWKSLIDREYGGFYGYVDFDLNINKNAPKGVILNSRILWFFANAYRMENDAQLLKYANHAYEFLVDKCLDKVNGGVYWMLNHDGTIADPMKHTYNQAFAIYALSSFFMASGDHAALRYAMDLFERIESTCTDPLGYREAFTRDWTIINNDKLSENGVLADKTMNTLLHVLEAYTSLYEACHDFRVKERLVYILDLFRTKVFNPDKKRLEVFFDSEMNSITDLHSYGHDIEASWLLDAAADIIGDKELIAQTRKMTAILAENVLDKAVTGAQNLCRQGQKESCPVKTEDAELSVNNECFHGVVDDTKVWWVQAEAIVGFYHAFVCTENERYKDATERIWKYVENHFVDDRPGSEWFWDLDSKGRPISKKPVTEPWKCPYHNGRMCFEMVRREKNDVSGKDETTAAKI